MNRNGDNGWQEEILAKIDDNRLVYLCEYGIVHFRWDQNDLVYCPGDFVGLPFVLYNLGQPCNQACMHGKDCPYRAEDGLVYLPYHSVKLPFSVDECRQMHQLVLVASKQLYQLLHRGLRADCQLS